MRFRNVFLWLKFTTITPSFYFKNRLFIERGLRVNNMYTYLGNTQKSFTWLPTSSSNLSLYWFRRRGAKWALLLLLLLLLVFFLFDFSHFTPWGNTQVVRALCYVFWRTLDCIFFFSAHFFIFFFATLTWGFRYLTNFASTKYWAWAISTRNTVPNTLNPDDRLRDLYSVTSLSSPSHFAPSSLTLAPSEFTNNSTIELVGDLYRLLLVTAPTLVPLNLTNTKPLPSLLRSPRPTSLSLSSTTHSCFFLQAILPASVPLRGYSVCVQDVNSLAGFYSGFLSPNTINFGYGIQGNNIRAVRWLFRSVSSMAKDTPYVHNLLSSSLSRQLQTPFIGQGGTPDSVKIPLAIEWFGFRSTYLTRPSLIESLVMSTQKLQQDNPLITVPFTDWIKPSMAPQRGIFLWGYWSDFFTNKNHLVITWGSASNLTRAGLSCRTIRRWL